LLPRSYIRGEVLNLNSYRSFVIPKSPTGASVLQHVLILISEVEAG
jgi:hypothetical protein